MIIDNQITECKPTQTLPWDDQCTGLIQFKTSQDVAEFMIAHDNGENIIDSLLKEQLEKAKIYKKYRSNRSLLKESLYFQKYRKTKGSKKIHELAIRQDSGEILNAREDDILKGLSKEIQKSKTKFHKNQIVYHGTSCCEAKKLLNQKLPSFLSTSLSIKVALWHAKDSAKFKTDANKFTFTPMLLELKLSRKLSGFFVSTSIEKEILFDRSLKITPVEKEITLSNGFIFQKAHLE